MFPRGVGDGSAREGKRQLRKTPVSFEEAVEHYTWFAIETENGFYYPFARDLIWVFWYYDMGIRHELLKQTNRFISVDAEFGKRNEETLLESLRGTCKSRIV